MAILEARGLKKHFPASVSPFRTERLRAVDGVDFSVGRDKVFAIVGESGCGKSTVARLLLRLLEPTTGEVIFKGKNVSTFAGAELKAFRKSIQIIFQDPFASLNPRMSVFDAVAEPLRIHNLSGKAELRDKVSGLLEMVGLSGSLDAYPHEFSGGQRQRICIARALAVSPEIIVADEPLSALDVSIQAQILNLLIDLREKTGVSYVFISHDLRVVEYLSDEVSVMYLGKIVESSKTEEFFDRPLHPYSEILLSSAPQAGRKEGPSLKGEVPSPIHVPPGCPFHPRCPKRFAPCDKVVPELRPCEGRQVSCHLWNPV